MAVPNDLCGNCSTFNPLTNGSFNQTGNESSTDFTENYHRDNDEWSMNDNVRSLLIEPPRIIALVLGFLAISLNVMSLLALFHVKHKTKTHLKLVASLAMSDIVIGISVILYFMTTAINPTYDFGSGPKKGRLISRCMFIFTKALNSMGLNISLLNLTGMAIDHYLAITKPLKYLPENSKSGVLIIAMWVVSVILGFSDFFTGNKVYQRRKPKYNYCEAVYLSLYQDEYTVFTVGLCTSIIMLCVYIRIYWYIRKHELPGESYSSIPQKHNSSKHAQQRNRQSNLKAGKALKTTLLILGTFFMCWTPNCLYQVALIIQVKINPAKLNSWASALYVLDQYFLDLLLLNSAIDPVIYAFRIRDIQLGYRRLFQRCFKESHCLCNVQEQRVSFRGIEENSSTQMTVTNKTELKLLSKSSVKSMV